MRLRRESDILGMTFSSIGLNLSVLGKSCAERLLWLKMTPPSGSAAALPEVSPRRQLSGVEFQRHVACDVVHEFLSRKLPLTLSFDE
jgi:hypothetical protein